ncbi:hypothetical protein TSUD_09240 [Trifolium subterraneum]|nr:hypothetical protein TSUD_09240 [Trifolium subterraneum]
MNLNLSEWIGLNFPPPNSDDEDNMIYATTLCLRMTPRHYCMPPPYAYQRRKKKMKFEFDDLDKGLESGCLKKLKHTCKVKLLCCCGLYGGKETNSSSNSTMVEMQEWTKPSTRALKCNIGAACYSELNMYCVEAG